MTLRDDIAVLEDRRFRWFFIGRAVSTVGSSMTAVALAFAVLQIGSAKDLGLVMAVFSVCQIAFLVIGGVLADRLPRAVIIQSTYALTAVTQAMVATLFLTGAASIPRLLVLEGINGAAMAFTMPAMQGLVPQLVPHQHLQQATALMSFVRSSAMIGARGGWRTGRGARPGVGARGRRADVRLLLPDPASARSKSHDLDGG